jgi:hypothetical protein
VLITILILSNIKFCLFKNYHLNNIKMDNEEILRRIKLHNDLFTQYEDCIEDKGIVLLAKRYMELFFFELMKNNIVNDTKKEKLNSKL